MSKYTATERVLVKSIFASLSIKRIPESEIMKEVFSQTNKKLSRSGVYRVKQSIKKESAKWMMNLAKNGRSSLAFTTILLQDRCITLLTCPHKDLIEWRRNKVLELSAQGLNQSEISKKLRVNQSQISRDIKFLREYARKNVEIHLQEKLPEEYQLCLTGLNQVLKKSWEIANSNSSSVDDKTRLQALGLVNDCYKYKMDLVTNGTIITDALRFVQQQKKEELSKHSEEKSSPSTNKLF